jgi:glutamate synthase domain-containing protein 2
MARLGVFMILSRITAYKGQRRFRVRRFASRVFENRASARSGIVAYAFQSGESSDVHAAATASSRIHEAFHRHTLCVLATAALLAAVLADPAAFNVAAIPLALFASLTVLGTHDLIQTRHAVLRNYPISAHLRFLLEEMRPEMRQYFFEGEKDGTPFSRDKRAVVYQRAKMVLDKRPFGTQYDVYAEGFEWIRHSMMPRPLATEPFRIAIGGPDGTRPYSASVFNISAMSFGALSPNAIRALNNGAKAGNFAHDTGEGGFSPYHRENGGDIIWEIGSGYFGCRNPDGTFLPATFAESATLDQVKMVELKMSQGATRWSF